MSAPCYNYIMTYGEDEWPDGCENDSTGEMKCEYCNFWLGSYTCPGNDETYYYRIEKGLSVGGYIPNMSKEETIEWFEAYKKKHRLA